VHQLIRATKTGALVRIAGIVAAAAWLAGVASMPAHARAAQERTVQDGVFSRAQAERGQALYAQRCASCHGPAMQGVSAPPLAGTPFVSRWSAEPIGALLSKIRHTMPPTAAGQLTDQQAADLVAHLLQAGGFPAGTTELAIGEATNRIGWPASARQTSAPGAAAGGRSYQPLGSLAQLMRAVFFPNSNLIFTVQTRDPGAPAPPPSAAAQDKGFNWIDWGAGIYGGWQLVDNAAIALADVSPLMLSPELRCENGRPAPVTDPEWIKFTDQMIAVSKQIYRLSQSRNQEAVAVATGDLSDACFACHQAYRDVRRGGGGRPPDPTDPSINASRCLSRR
jgi:mono/diheme cytochrome c family protein